ncbi:MAG: rhodanese-like domain-containing protein [Bacteroidetes bacterium]|nr:rhodanese-like domain-containing protein [Bacteroidota bacterium]
MRVSYAFGIGFFALFLTGINVQTSPTASPATITPSEVDSLQNRDTTHVLLDVRTREEFDGPLGHLEGALLIPVQELEIRIDELSPFKNKTIVAICRSGVRSAHATALLNAKGFHALNMTGGMVRWNAEGRPVIHTENQ